MCMRVFGIQLECKNGGFAKPQLTISLLTHRRKKKSFDDNTLFHIESSNEGNHNEVQR